MAEHGRVGPEREGRRVIQVYMVFTRTVMTSKHGDISTSTKRCNLCMYREKYKKKMKEQDHVHLTMIQGYKSQLVYPSDILNNIFNEATLYGIYCSHKRLLRKFQCICITYCKPTFICDFISRFTGEKLVPCDLFSRLSLTYLYSKNKVTARCVRDVRLLQTSRKFLVCE